MNDNTLRDAVQTAMPAAGNHLGLDREAVAWAWAQPVANNPGARIVLLCLAVMTDDSWECLASQEEIAEVALLSARSVRRYLEQLEDGGHIQRHKRFDEKGHRISDRCRLNPSESLPANLDGRQVSPVANLAVREPDQRPDWPLVNLDSGPEQGEHLPANLANGQSDLWPDWPVGEPSETDIPSSEPVAKLTTGQIGRASSSPTENYQKNNPSSSPPKKPSKSKPATDAVPREDVERLCARLLGWMKHNQVRKTPDAVSDAWRREARLLLDKDEVPFEEALQVLNWSQRDGFWSQNIHSMPTFRDKYGQLEMKSRGHRGDAQVHQLRPTGTTGPAPARSTTDDRVAQAQALKGRFGPAAPSTIAGEITS
ncbi:helix-turn-helix domain-containing protein [Streptosporangium sp. G12]